MRQPLASQQSTQLNLTDASSGQAKGDKPLPRPPIPPRLSAPAPFMVQALQQPVSTNLTVEIEATTAKLVDQSPALQQPNYLIQSSAELQPTVKRLRPFNLNQRLTNMRMKSPLDTQIQYAINHYHIQQISKSSVGLKADNISPTGQVKKLLFKPPVPPIPSVLTMIPRQLAVKVLGELDEQSLCNAAAVSLSWHEIANDPILWFERCMQRNWHRLSALPFDFVSKVHFADESESSGVNWKQVYIMQYAARCCWLHGHYTSYELGFKILLRIPKPSENSHTRSRSTGGVVKRPSKLYSLETSAALTDLIKTEPAHKQMVLLCKLDADQCVTTSRDGKVKIWLLETKETLLELIVPANINCYSDEAFQQKPSITSLELTLGLVIAGSNEGAVLVWSRMTGDLLFNLDREHDDCVTALTILNASDGSESQLQLDNDRLKSVWFATSSQDGTSRVYSITHQQTQQRSKVKRFTMSGTVKIQLERVFDHNGSGVYAQCLVNPFQVASGGYDGIIRVWFAEHEAKSSAELIGHTNSVTNVKLLNDKILLSSSLDKTLRMWSVDDVNCLKTIDIDLDIKALAVLRVQKSDRVVFASSNFQGEVTVWSVSNDKQKVTRQLWSVYVPESTDGSKSDHITALSLDNFYLVCGSRSGRVHVYQLF